MKINKQNLAVLIELCKKEYPKEACGILAGTNGLVKKVYPLQNVSEKPETCYFMEPKEQLQVFKEMRKNNLAMLAIYHSHIKVPAYPSKKDTELAFYPDAGYVIISLSESNLNHPSVKLFRIIAGTIQEESFENIE
jgi:proteasome lid subunit RPN8/RPN11